MKVLVADDEEDLREIVAFDLKDGGFEFRFAASGREAKEALLAERIDVAILDVKMPEGQGTEIVAFARDHCPHTLCIMLTGSDEREVIKACLRNGAFDFIEKPYEKDFLMRSVARACEVVRFRTQRDRLLEYLLVNLGNVSLADFTRLPSANQARVLDYVLNVVKLKLGTTESAEA